jgi:hypothetical protein
LFLPDQHQLSHLYQSVSKYDKATKSGIHIILMLALGNIRERKYEVTSTV